MGVEKNFPSCSYQSSSLSLSHGPIMVGGGNKPVLKLRDMEEKHLHNLFLKNMSGLIEEVKNPTPRLNPNSKCGGMATHAGLALELDIRDFTQSWANGLAFCALIHNFFPQSFDFKGLKTDTAADRRRNFEIAFTTGEKFAGVPDFLTAEDMSGMVEESRVDPKMIFSYVQEVYRMCNEL